MIERPGPVLRWFFGRFFKQIDFPKEGAEKIRRAAERGTVVYVVKTLSYIDYLYFSYAFLKYALPLSRFANGVKTLMMQPLGKILRGALRLWRERRTSSVAELSEVVRQGESALLFLKRPHTLFGWEPVGFRGAHVEELIRIQRERGQTGKPILFVPLTLLWGSPAVRAARSRRGLVDLIFGEREAPGRVRAMYTFFSDYKESQVLVGEPLELPKFLADEGDAPDEVLARRLRWQLGGRLESEVRVVLGPPRKNVRRIQEEVLRSRRLVAEAKEIEQAEKSTPKQIEKRARAQLKEIAADPKPWMFGVSRPIMSWVFRKIFDGIEIDVEGLEKVRAAARKGPLVIVPSHKSHIDYLVLSYVFLLNDLVPPLVAAGANLSFWPLGFFFRRGGAFFLRRTFRGDKLYGAVFRAYVRKLLRESFNVEFFIEGGRSRTGKLLAPKLGLLGMVVEAALDDDGAHARKAQVVPISIGYEKVIEEKSYAKEAAGGEKKKEDMKGLLKATRVLGARYGRLNIQFDDPLPLGPTLREYGAMAAWDEGENLVVPAEEEQWKAATMRLAHRVVYGINRVTAVTPTALTAAALLATGRRGIVRRELLAQAKFLMERAQAVGGRLSAALVDHKGALDVEAFDRAIELLARDGDIEVRAGGASGAFDIKSGRPLDEIYTVPDERRPRLAYYRNNAIHLFVADGLVALALGGAAKHGLVAVDDLRQRTLRVSRLLKLEFTYRVGETFETIFDQTLAGLQAAGLIGTATHGVHPAPGAVPRLALLAGQVTDFVESYLIAARALEALTSPTSDKDLVRRIHDLGEKMFFTGEVRRREACVRASYVNAIAYFKERGALVEKDKKLSLAPGVDARRIATEIADLLPPSS
ncbi:MAG: Glycerol-3-phosphate acyltransferase [Myxococcales bacterium]|nr:Glycerol-3-phosphate acyltransferase [Myxococcales bacterium]